MRGRVLAVSMMAAGICVMCTQPPSGGRGRRREGMKRGSGRRYTSAIAPALTWWLRTRREGGYGGSVHTTTRAPGARARSRPRRRGRVSRGRRWQRRRASQAKDPRSARLAQTALRSSTRCSDQRKEDLAKDEHSNGPPINPRAHNAGEAHAISAAIRLSPRLLIAL